MCVLTNVYYSEISNVFPYLHLSDNELKFECVNFTNHNQTAIYIDFIQSGKCLLSKAFSRINNK